MMAVLKETAGHHRECGEPYERCTCRQLRERDAAESDDIQDAYREMYDPDWGSE